MIKMKKLTSLFQKLGFNDILTYLQSGNVVFSSPESAELIAGKIEKAILKEFGHKVPAIVRTIAEIEAITDINPFTSEKDYDPAKSAVIFLNNQPDQGQLLKVADINYPPDRFKIIGKEIFIFCPNGFGRTKLYTGFFEDKMKLTGTARNWKTIAAITEIASGFK